MEKTGRERYGNAGVERKGGETQEWMGVLRTGLVRTGQVMQDGKGLVGWVSQCRRGMAGIGLERSGLVR